MNTTTSSAPEKLMDVKSFEFMKKQLEKSVMETISNGGWILVSPDGKMYQGDIRQIGAVVMENHPLFKSSFGNGMQT